ncbi:hypothetical protein NDU88_004236 [Pleurodeles waltl]|uniref:Uncharacterized protein n=1 Tax=Pleurodeles waltl TaxID=8319 RepID=A0AAV7V2H0_PLEWA|nr:hypothetical protein NDU88_004236 [Pleurodeles waltl]
MLWRHALLTSKQHFVWPIHDREPTHWKALAQGSMLQIEQHLSGMPCHAPSSACFPFGSRAASAWNAQPGTKQCLFPFRIQSSICLGCPARHQAVLVSLSDPEQHLPGMPSPAPSSAGFPFGSRAASAWDAQPGTKQCLFPFRIQSSICLGCPARHQAVLVSLSDPEQHLPGMPCHAPSSACFPFGSRAASTWDAQPGTKQCLFPFRIQSSICLGCPARHQAVLVSLSDPEQHLPGMPSPAPSSAGFPFGSRAASAWNALPCTKQCLFPFRIQSSICLECPAMHQAVLVSLSDPEQHLPGMPCHAPSSACFPFGSRAASTWDAQPGTKQCLFPFRIQSSICLGCPAMHQAVLVSLSDPEQHLPGMPSPAPSSAGFPFGSRAASTWDAQPGTKQCLFPFRIQSSICLGCPAMHQAVLVSLSDPEQHLPGMPSPAPSSAGFPFGSRAASAWDALPCTKQCLFPFRIQSSICLGCPARHQAVLVSLSDPEQHLSGMPSPAPSSACFPFGSRAASAWDALPCTKQCLFPFRTQSSICLGCPARHQAVLVSLSDPEQHLSGMPSPAPSSACFPFGSRAASTWDALPCTKQCLFPFRIQSSIYLGCLARHQAVLVSLSDPEQHLPGMPCHAPSSACFPFGSRAASAWNAQPCTKQCLFPFRIQSSICLGCPARHQAVLVSLSDPEQHLPGMPSPAPSSACFPFGSRAASAWDA